jgi:hypothetical protein
VARRIGELAGRIALDDGVIKIRLYQNAEKAD